MERTDKAMEPTDNKRRGGGRSARVPAQIGIHFKVIAIALSLASCNGAIATRPSSPPVEHRTSDPVCASSDAGTDQCHADTDCPSDGVCACVGESLGGSSGHLNNVCVPGGNCRVDANCVAVPYCSPSRGQCGSVTGWFCHTTGDECDNASDCSTGTCQYSPALGHWACTAVQVCTG